MSPDEYLKLVEARLSAEGATVTKEDFNGIPAVIGYRPKFRLRWMATKLNLFTIVIPQEAVTEAALQRFTDDALAYAIARKGQLRGLQTGVAAIPVIVGSQIEPAAIAFAEKKIVKKWSAFAWPAIVDLSTGAVHTHQGRVAIGGIYASWMRQQTAVALKAPTT